MASAAVRALAKVRTPRVTLEQLTGEVADRRRAGAYLHGVLPPLLARAGVGARVHIFHLVEEHLDDLRVALALRILQGRVAVLVLRASPLIQRPHTLFVGRHVLLVVI